MMIMIMKKKMKNISTYIIEKLVIDKDVNVQKLNTDTAVSCICDICSISFEKEDNKKMIEEIEKWCQDNKIEKLDDFVCKSPLEHIRKKSYSYVDNLEKKGWIDHIEEIPNDKIQEYKDDIRSGSLIATSGFYKKLYLNDILQPPVLAYVFDFIDAFFIFEKKEK